MYFSQNFPSWKNFAGFNLIFLVSWGIVCSFFWMESAIWLLVLSFDKTENVSLRKIADKFCKPFKFLQCCFHAYRKFISKFGKVGPKIVNSNFFLLCQVLYITRWHFSRKIRNSCLTSALRVWTLAWHSTYKIHKNHFEP